MHTLGKHCTNWAMSPVEVPTLTFTSSNSGPLKRYPYCLGFSVSPTPKYLVCQVSPALSPPSELRTSK